MPEADASTPQGAAAVLRSTAAIRTRANALLARARAGDSQWFIVNDGALPMAATLVAELTQARYPDLKIPFHSRWRHFEAGGRDRKAILDQALAGADSNERARAHIDLALVSVLLDAGAGPDWQYLESDGHGLEHPFTRSEGLGVASFNAFMGGLFSSDTDRPSQVDAAGLKALTTPQLAKAFQASDHNPLVGLQGRAELLQRLGAALQAQPGTFGKAARPGHLFDAMCGSGQAVDAHRLLSLLLESLSGIWPAQNMLGATPLGDCWRHPSVAGDGLTHGWMPFHKLSQWLCYSLLEPFEWAGRAVTGVNQLTGLPEYRNGGLLLDAGVLRLENEHEAARLHQAGDALIVEWRALTVSLLDELAVRVRQQLGLTEENMPLACVLEGGTWAAGRVLAQQLRGGVPPLRIESDGTVF
jgi:Protein of unknown function (DUF1688)